MWDFYGQRAIEMVDNKQVIVLLGVDHPHLMMGVTRCRLHIMGKTIVEQSHLPAIWLWSSLMSPTREVAQMKKG